MPTSLTSAEFKEQMRKNQAELDKTMAWLKEMSADPSVPIPANVKAKHAIKAIEAIVADDLTLILKLQAKVNEVTGLLRVATKLMGEMVKDDA